MPWCWFVLGEVEGVNGEPIPDCTYAAYGPGCYSTTCYNNRTCGIRQAVDAYITSGATGSYGPIEDWDTSLVTDMSWVFYKKHTFNADISKWNTSSVRDMNRMFRDVDIDNDNVITLGEIAILVKSFENKHQKGVNKNIPLASDKKKQDPSVSLNKNQNKKKTNNN